MDWELVTEHRVESLEAVEHVVYRSFTDKILYPKQMGEVNGEKESGVTRSLISLRNYLLDLDPELFEKYYNSKRTEALF